MAAALGIIGRDTKRDLDTMRGIRNLLAHTAHPVTFRTRAIKSACWDIKIIDRLSWGGEAGRKPSTAKRRFISAAQYYCAFLAMEGVDDDDLDLSTLRALLHM
jgi:hypothetical protein